jgi:hypothetical protein
VAFVFWNTEYYDACHASRFFRTIQRVDSAGGSPVQMIPKPDFARLLPACDLARPTITREDVEVVGSGAPWPWDKDYSTWRLAAESSTSNVTGALGFLGGVLTKWTREEGCALSAPPSSDTFCKLRYDSTTATLRGTVAGSCPVPPDSVHIELRELTAPPGEPTRTRLGILDLSGGYDIGALRPGVPHALTIFVGDTTGRYRPALPFRVVHDTLSFTAGQVARRDATLELTGPCPKL